MWWRNNNKVVFALNVRNQHANTDARLLPAGSGQGRRGLVTCRLHFWGSGAEPQRGAGRSPAEQIWGIFRPKRWIFNQIFNNSTQYGGVDQVL